MTAGIDRGGLSRNAPKNPVRAAHMVDRYDARTNFAPNCLASPWTEMSDSFPELLVRSFQDLADALRAVQLHRQVSNAALEHAAGVCSGFVDKYLGPSRGKRLSETSLTLLMGALGVRLRVEIDEDQVRQRWEKRDGGAVRYCQPVSQATLDRYRPVILSEMARKGWQTRRRHTRRNGHAAK
jgi:hypothetical protein